jgi:hypothetical protein
MRAHNLAALGEGPVDLQETLNQHGRAAASECRSSSAKPGNVCMKNQVFYCTNTLRRLPPCLQFEASTFYAASEQSIAWCRRGIPANRYRNLPKPSLCLEVCPNMQSGHGLHVRATLSVPRAEATTCVTVSSRLDVQVAPNCSAILQNVFCSGLAVPCCMKKTWFVAQ